jgi:hypothetical protein
MKSRRNRKLKNRKSKKGAGAFGFGSKMISKNIKDCDAYKNDAWFKDHPGQCSSLARTYRFPGLDRLRMGTPFEDTAHLVNDVY